MITLGLVEIQVGDVVTATGEATGAMPETLTKIGKTYQNTAAIAQEASEVTEHFEEGKAAPEVRMKTKKVPVLTFSIMDPDPALMAKYIGGTSTGTAPNLTWGYDGSEVVANKAIKVITKQGLDFEIPNGDIEAVLNGELAAEGIILVDFTVTPLAVAAGAKSFRAVPKGAGD